MSIQNEYLQGVQDRLTQQNPHEKEFLQATEEVLESLVPVVEQRPEFIRNGVIDRIVEPERTLMFRVSWVDNQGKVQVNRGLPGPVLHRYRSLQGRPALPPLGQPVHHQVPGL